jgi:hypothetical protein
MESSKTTHLVSSEFNTSNGAIALTFAKPDLIVKIVEFNSASYISCGAHLLPLHTFLQVRSAVETDAGLKVTYGPDWDRITLTYADLSALAFVTIMCAVEDVIEDNNISTAPPYWLEDESESESEESSPSVLDRIIPPPNPDTLQSPYSQPLTLTDQVAFAIGLLAFVVALLHSVYLSTRL